MPLSERAAFYDEDGLLVPSRLFAEIERLREALTAAQAYIERGSRISEDEATRQKIAEALAASREEQQCRRGTP